MGEPRYRPWRTDDQPANLLDEQAAMSWTKLVEESRQSIAGLTRLRADLEQHMQSGAALVGWLRDHAGNVDSDSSRDTIDALERRLSRIERRLTEVEAALTQAGRPGASPADEQGDDILRRFRSKAA